MSSNYDIGQKRIFFNTVKYSFGTTHIYYLKHVIQFLLLYKISLKHHHLKQLS